MLVGVRLRSVVIMFEKLGFPLKILSMSTTLLLFLEIIDVSVSQTYLTMKSLFCGANNRTNVCETVHSIEAFRGDTND